MQTSIKIQSQSITSTPLRTLVAGVILSALALGFAPVSSAEEGATPPQVIVKYGDLDVSTSKGAAALYGRIHGAARYPEEAEAPRRAPVPQEAPLAPPRPVVGGIGRLLVEGRDDLGEE